MISEPELTGGFPTPPGSGQQTAGAPAADSVPGGGPTYGRGPVHGTGSPYGGGPPYGSPPDPAPPYVDGGASAYERPYRVPAQGGPADDVVAGRDGPGPLARLRARIPRHWAWALGGVVAASAVWAGGIVAWDPTHPALPDLHGYHLATDPCTSASLRPLFAAAAGDSPVSSGVVNVLRSTAVDAQTCTAYTVPTANAAPATAFTPAFTAALTITLHKTTDPRPEFESAHTLPHGSLTTADSAKPVTGLGDQAYLLRQGPSLIGLEVLYGGVVVRLEFSIAPGRSTLTAHPDGSPTPDPPGLDRYRTALIEAMHNVLAELRTAPA